MSQQLLTATQFFPRNGGAMTTAGLPTAVAAPVKVNTVENGESFSIGAGLPSTAICRVAVTFTATLSGNVAVWRKVDIHEDDCGAPGGKTPPDPARNFSVRAFKASPSSDQSPLSCLSTDSILSRVTNNGLAFRDQQFVGQMDTVIGAQHRVRRADSL